MILFGFFSLVLVMVYWINRAVVLFDRLIANGQSATVFLEFTILSLPNVIRLVLPMAAFAASAYVANRLTSESELVVVQATGFSPYRLVRPVLAFGVIVALLLSVLTHFLVPASLTQLSQRQAQISENITARLLVPGTFLHPVNGVTFYIRDISQRGELKDIFISDARSDTERSNYSARHALLVRQDSGPKLLMFDGMVQTLSLDDNRLSVTSFADLTYDISALVNQNVLPKNSVSQLSTAELLRADPELMKQLGQKPGTMLDEGHQRFVQALLCIVAALIGFSTLLVGGYSRFGLWRQILGGIALLVLVKMIDNVMIDKVRADASLWPLEYASTLLGLAVTWLVLWVSARPALFARRERALAA